MLQVVNGVETFWDQTGRGLPLVCIHHLGGSGDSWLPVVLRLGTRCRCVTYDVRGHGRSAVPPGPYTLAQLADDLAALIESLGLSRVSLAGISMGGMIAMTLAVARPDLVDTLTLVDTCCEYPDDMRAGLRSRADQAERSGTAALAAGSAERWFTPAFRTLDRHAVEAQVEILRATDPAGYAAAARAVAAVDLAEPITRLRCPTLILVGAQDASTPIEAARRLDSLIPASELHIIPTAAHLPIIEQTELVSVRIERFLAAHANPVGDRAGR